MGPFDKIVKPNMIRPEGGETLIRLYAKHTPEQRNVDGQFTTRVNRLKKKSWNEEQKTCDRGVESSSYN